MIIYRLSKSKNVQIEVQNIFYRYSGFRSNGVGEIVKFCFE
jgi:hypothetical protein